jgi:hypothetical protein
MGGCDCVSLVAEFRQPRRSAGIAASRTLAESSHGGPFFRPAMYMPLEYSSETCVDSRIGTGKRVRHQASAGPV